MEDATAAPKTPKKRGAAAASNNASSQPTKKRSPVKKEATASDAPEPTTPSPKKRVLSKKKDVADANVTAANGDTAEANDPVTPKKGKRTSAKAKATNDATNGGSSETTDKSVSPTKGNGEIEGTTVHNTPRKRQAPKKELAAPRGIPGSWDDADQADRMLVTMKEKGDSWTDIRAAWKAVTGQETASR